MTEHTVLHKAHTIHLMSYKLGDGQWVPEAWVHLSSQDKEQGQPLRNDSVAPLPTRDAANAVAKTLAMAWVDTQPPATADRPVRLSWTFETPIRPGWYWYRERGMNLDFPMPAWVVSDPPFVYVSLFAVREKDPHRQAKQVKECPGEWWGPFDGPK